MTIKLYDHDGNPLGTAFLLDQSPPPRVLDWQGRTFVTSFAPGGEMVANEVNVIAVLSVDVTA